ncbi:MAG: sugar phosphate isomerase/epimerase [Akkermansiaceae bacterium]|nr:sugar phosphate isomerase/epimerase [Akkermansiaceae bacterium]NNM30977.1 sugar phosphate isomerase/epimerase [Akkermansiaceae bacterium]
MLALSTCWNNSRHTDGEGMIDEILELGFDTVELSHGMTITKLPGLQKAFRAGKFRCAGVHNYFPSPTEVMIDAPDAYEFSSHRTGDRQRAMEMTLKTLEVAAEFGAGYLVLHMGSVPLMPHRKWTGRLTGMLKDGQALSPKYAAHKIKCVKKREKTGPVYFNRAMATLESLAAKAEEYGVKLAVESRSKYEDVPTEREMIALQEHFKDTPWVGYWHDFGHVQLKHNLGLLDHKHWLSQMEPYVIGAHVHDVHWPHRDHRVPFTGTIDYPPLMRHFRPEMPFVWELSPTREAEQIREALPVWNQLFPETLQPVSPELHPA